MAAFSRRTQRFAFGGIQLAPPDALGPGKYPYVQNLRAFEDNALQVRAGLAPVGTVAADVHSLWRLNDTSSFTATPAVRLVGAGTVLYAGPPPSGPYTSALTGLSGNPLTLLNANPTQSPRPWTYIGDSLVSGKINTDGVVYGIGLAPPLAPPTVALAAPGVAVLDELTAVGSWTALGSGGALSAVARVNTTISSIQYDSGTTGYACIRPASMANLAAGARVSLAGAEIVLIEEVTIAIAATTIAAIIYDSGTNGPCTIQPVGSLGTGLLVEPPLADYAARLTVSRTGGPGLTGVAQTQQNLGPLAFEETLGALGITPSQAMRNAIDAAAAPQTQLLGQIPSTSIRQIDFPVNALVILNSAETVRILSVALGSDGVQSFRCNTTLTHAAGETLAGVAKRSGPSARRPVPPGMRSPKTASRTRSRPCPRLPWRLWVEFRWSKMPLGPSSMDARPSPMINCTSP